MIKIEEFDYLTNDFLGEFILEMNQLSKDCQGKKRKFSEDTSFLYDFDHVEMMYAKEHKKMMDEEKKINDSINEVFNSIIKIPLNSPVLTDVSSVISATLYEANLLSFCEQEEQEEARLLREYSDLDHLLKFDENYP